MNAFRVVVADPPWPMRWSGGGWRVNGDGRRPRVKKANVTTLPYPTMSIDEIASLNVSAIAAPDAVLFLWAPDVFVIDGSAAKVCKAWGFSPGRLIVWAKRGFGLGVFPRPQHEVALFAKRGIVKPLRRDVGSVHTWKLVYERAGASSARKHSAKPAGFLAMVEQVYSGPYVELFARNTRLGWTTWGDEVPVDDALTATLARDNGLRPATQKDWDDYRAGRLG